MEVGTYRTYIKKRFSDEALTLIGHARNIINEYEPNGYSLTLRQLYYQFVARALLPNSDKSYNKLGAIISDARMSGLISWTAIEDRGRSLRGLTTKTGIQEALVQAREDFRHDLWENQPMRPEVWIEKQALEGVIEPICNDLRVNFFATKGYNSQSEQWRAGRRLAQYVQRGQRPIILHLGDHDPSGIDMTRDNEERLSLFAGVPILVRRLALNYDQIEELDPPPNPAKVTDSRADAYIAKYGNSSWELDALDTPTIHGIIREAVLQYRDESLWNDALKAEAEDLDGLDVLIEAQNEDQQ